MIALALACAFALQGFIFALEVGNAAFAATNGAAWAGFELCAHSGVAPTVPGMPDQGPIGNVHCMFCIAGAVFLSAAPLVAPKVRQVLLAYVMAGLPAGRLVPPKMSESAWPRGPPA